MNPEKHPLGGYDLRLFSAKKRINPEIQKKTLKQLPLDEYDLRLFSKSQH